MPGNPLVQLAAVSVMPAPKAAGIVSLMAATQAGGFSRNLASVLATYAGPVHGAPGTKMSAALRSAASHSSPAVRSAAVADPPRATAPTGPRPGSAALATATVAPAVSALEGATQPTRNLASAAEGGETRPAALDSQPGMMRGADPTPPRGTSSTVTSSTAAATVPIDPASGVEPVVPTTSPARSPRAEAAAPGRRPADRAPGVDPVSSASPPGRLPQIPVAIPDAVQATPTVTPALFAATAVPALPADTPPQSSTATLHAQPTATAARVGRPSNQSVPRPAASASPAAVPPSADLPPVVMPPPPDVAPLPGTIQAEAVPTQNDGRPVAQPEAVTQHTAATAPPPDPTGTGPAAALVSDVNLGPVDPGAAAPPQSVAAATPADPAAPASMLAAPVAAATTAASAPAAAPAVHVSPVAQVAPVLLAFAASATGAQHVTLRLEPADLGSVQIRIDRPVAAPAHVEVSVTRPETLSLLLRDQTQLQHTLDRAGVPPEGRTLTFNLTGQDADGLARQSGGFQHTGTNGRPTQDSASSDDATGPETALPMTPPTGWRRAGLDITA